MLTAYQCETVAYQTEYGDLLCPDCFDRGDDFARPLIRYSLDEEQTYRAEDGYCAVTEDSWDNESGCGCEPAIYCDHCYAELLEEYVDTYYHEQLEDEDFVQRLGGE